MKHSGTCLLILLFAVHFSFAQTVSEQKRKEILKEGNLLYRLELASWNATDLLNAISGINTLDSIGGYLSYKLEKSYNTIFFGDQDSSRIFAHFVFDSICSVQSAILDMSPRKANKMESKLIIIRQDAMKRIWENKNDFFLSYDSTSFNVDLVVSDKGTKVFVLTGPEATGNVLFGNDYVIEYSPDNKFKAQTKLHRDLIPIPMEATPDSGNVFATIHSHVEPTSEYITPTDICTLLLYGQYTNWKQHYVISDKFVSIWDVNKNTLKVVTRQAFDKTNH